MPRPTDTTPFQEDLYASLEPIADQDEAHNWALLHFCGAVAAMFDQIETYARDTEDGKPGWSILVDGDRFPLEAAEWIGQLAGTRPTLGKLLIFLAKNWIKNPNGLNGTVGWTSSSTTGATAITSVADSSALSGNAIQVAATGVTNSGNLVQAIQDERTFANSSGMITAGQRVLIRGRVKLQSASAAVSSIAVASRNFDSSNSFLGGVAIAQNNPVVGTWYELSMIVSVPAGVAYYDMDARLQVAAAGDFTIRAERFQITPLLGDQADPGYFDGGTTNARWDGTANQSTSSLFARETDEQYLARIREEIKHAEGLNRGTLQSLITAGKRNLTGQKQVLIRERDGGPNLLTVVTFTSETPDAAITLKDLQGAKPAGLIMTHNVVPGQTYVLVQVTYANYNAVDTAFSTYNGLLTNIPGT